MTLGFLDTGSGFHMVELGPQVWKGATSRSQFATDKSFKRKANVDILGNALKLT